MRDECFHCHIKTVNKLIDKFKPSDEVSELFIKASYKLLNDKKDLSNPYLATNIHRLAKNIINHSDLYFFEKKYANKLLITEYNKWREFINDKKEPLRAAAKLAVAGNIIDYGAHSVPEDIEEQIVKLFNCKLAIDQTEELVNEISQAKQILYLGDNAGEIVFDRLFIETMEHPYVTYAVRGKPVLNDVTKEDAWQTGIDKICKVISNGYDAPSTLLPYCSEEFIQAFRKADLIISKGQGNFEGLMDANHPNMFVLLMAKCKPMADLLKTNEGDLVIKKLEKIVYAF